MTQQGTTRRTVVRSAAWTVPAVAIVAAAPAYATSEGGGPIPSTGTVGVCKFPGQSTDRPWGYKITVPLKPGADASSIVITSVTLNGTTMVVDGTQVVGNSLVVYVGSTNSADASGTVYLTYTAAGVTYDATFTYNGTPPCDRK